MECLRDKYFWVAMLAAPLFWIGLYFYLQTPLDWGRPSHQPWRFLLVGLAYPIVEEVVFRGLIQGYLLKRYPTPSRFLISRANAITTLLFSLAHALTRSVSVAVLVVPPSLLFGFFRERGNSLHAPILLHVFYNSGYFWLFGPV